jgi:hypothetical protein
MVESNEKTFGEKLAPILEDLQRAINSFDVIVKDKPCYPNSAVYSSAAIFISVIMDKMYDLMEREDMPITDKLKMAEQCGKDIHRIIKVYTDIDVHEPQQFIDRDDQ